MITLAVVGYLATGAGLGAWIYRRVSQFSLFPPEPDRRRRTVMSCAAMVVLWPGALLAWALYQTTVGREFIERFVFGDEAR